MVKFIATALLAAAATVAKVEGAALGVDFGDEFTKMTIVRPGTGFEIVENLGSGRKTTNMLSFFEKSRVFGDDALPHAARAPKKVFAFPKAYLSRTTDSPPSLGFEGYDSYFPIDAVADAERGVWDYKFGTEEQFSSEELIGHMLRFYRMLGAHTNKGKDVRDAVLTIPVDFTQRQRKAMGNAAQIAGIDILSLISETAAAAVHRGMDWKPTAEGDVDNALFINIGARYAEACVIRTSNGVNIPKKGTNSTMVNTLGCHAEPGVGGYVGDLLIADEMKKRFEKSRKKPLADLGEVTVQRVMKKLLRESKKTKHVLSTNKSSGFYVEGLIPDVDFREEITREAYEAMIYGPLTSKILNPIEKAIEKAGITFKDLTTVEVIGGGFRTPAVLASLNSYLIEESKKAGKPAPLELGQHLNGEESMSSGAAFVAANASALFRMKSMQFTDTIVHPVGVSFPGVAGEVSIVPANGSFVKGPRMITVDSSVAVSILGGKTGFLPGFDGDSLPLALNADGSLELVLQEDGIALETVKLLPPKDVEAINKILASSAAALELLPNEEVRKEAMGKFALKIKALVDQLGVVSVQSALLLIPTPPEVTTTTSTTTKAAAEGDAKKDDSTTTAAPKADEVKPVVAVGPWSTKGFLLKAEHVSSAKPLPISEDGIAFAKARIEKLEALDKELSDASNARNDLESFVYDTRNKIEGWEALETVTTPEQREQIAAKLEAAEAWLYDDAFGMEPKEFLAAVAEYAPPVKAEVTAHVERAKEYELRQKAKEIIGKLKGKVEKQLATEGVIPAWVTEEQRKPTVDFLAEIVAWFDEKLAEQEALPLTADPVFTYKEVSQKVTKLIKRVDALKAIPKPKPTTTSTSTTTKPKSSPKPKAEKKEGEEEQDGEKKVNDEEQEAAAAGEEQAENKEEAEEVKEEAAVEAEEEIKLDVDEDAPKQADEADEEKVGHDEL